MGKGDKKTRRGKINNGSFGAVRRRKKVVSIAPKEEPKKEAKKPAKKAAPKAAKKS